MVADILAGNLEEGLGVVRKNLEAVQVVESDLEEALVGYVDLAGIAEELPTAAAALVVTVENDSVVRRIAEVDHPIAVEVGQTEVVADRQEGRSSQTLLD